MRFDPNAPIEQQFTKNGTKVLEIYKNLSSGFGTPTFKVMLQGNKTYSDYNGDGRNMHASAFSDGLDLVTHQEVEPDVVSFYNVYPSMIGGANNSIEGANVATASGRKAIIKVTYSPSTGVIKIEKVG